MKYDIKKVNALILSFIFAIFSVGGFLSFIIATWTDQRYIDSLNLPPNADSTGIPLFGGILLLVMIGAVCLFYHLVLLAVTLSIKRIKTINILAIGQRHYSKALFIQLIAIIVLLSAVSWFYFGFENINPVSNASYIFGVVMFLASAIVNISTIISLVSQRKKVL